MDTTAGRHTNRSRTLNGISRCVGLLHVLRKDDVDAGDCVVITTKNSTYRLRRLGGNLYEASGGWFDRNPSFRTVTVNGCTFGGLAICNDVIAARGLFLEFGIANSVDPEQPQLVSTTRICDFHVIKLRENPDRVLN